VALIGIQNTFWLIDVTDYALHRELGFSFGRVSSAG